MNKTSARILLFLLLFVLWILLTLPPTQDELITGALVTAIVVLIFSASSSIFEEIKLTPKSIYYGFVYVLVFMKALVKANVDVALRVLQPSLPIKPGIVRVKTKLKSRLGRVILANSITLTPGTLTVETKGDDFFIHWIDVTSDNIEESTEQIVREFEKYLEVLFG